MSELSFLVLDQEGKKLVDTFKKLHPDGSDKMFKLLLKFYEKFAGWHKKKGRNPIIAFQDLIEREIKGAPYQTDEERIRYLNEMIEKNEEGAAGTSEEFKKEFAEIKDLIAAINYREQQSSSPRKGQSLENFTPSTEATLKKVSEGNPKKRKSYRDVRKKSGVKKISF